MTSKYFAALDSLEVDHHPLSDPEDEQVATRSYVSMLELTENEQIKFGYMSRTYVKNFFKLLTEVSRVLLSRLVQVSRDYAAKQSAYFGVASMQVTDEDTIYYRTLDFYSNLNNDAIHRETKTICDKHREFPEMFVRAFYFFIIDFYSKEQTIINVLEEDRRAKISFSPAAVGAKAGQVMYRVPTVQEFFSEYLKHFLNYPPVRTKEALQSWIVLVDTVHMNMIETFTRLVGKLVEHIKEEKIMTYDATRATPYRVVSSYTRHESFGSSRMQRPDGDRAYRYTRDYDERSSRMHRPDDSRSIRDLEERSSRMHRPDDSQSRSIRDLEERSSRMHRPDDSQSRSIRDSEERAVGSHATARSIRESRVESSSRSQLISYATRQSKLPTDSSQKSVHSLSVPSRTTNHGPSASMASVRSKPQAPETSYSYTSYGVRVNDTTGSRHMKITLSQAK